MNSAIHLVVLQPTSQCNLNCQYCYVPNRRDPARMADGVLEAAIVKALRSDLVRGKVEFLFHAGEPLMAGIPFFRKASQIINDNNLRGIAVAKSIQTNATLITDEWCDLFLQEEYRIGVSIDGPPHVHDTNRVNWSGRGTHSSVMRGVHNLQSHGVPFGAICVLSRTSLAYPDEIFSFFVDNGFQEIGFNIEEIESANTSSSMFPADPNEAARVEGEFRAFMSRLLELWEDAGRPIKIREFFDMAVFMLRKLRNPEARRVPDETAELGIVTVAKNGDMSPYSPEFAGSSSIEYGDFVVGHILESEYADILFDSRYTKIRRDVLQSLGLCAASCAYFDLCGGAFLSNKFSQNGTLHSTETTTCRLTRQTVADLLLDRWQEVPADAPTHVGAVSS
ncbi:cyclophane-forming radical SAM/SPASM peptide maturase GrrM/OscB [Mycolicibacterium helvum]|uniref:Radical SAM protein n=1 Tax=Mycolicibacterium helvum TaxID=1534349 RepID=A0A7I7TEK1_9MYCO|nr:cyclophane-forming radical SAM/SPASM peptide maturase GrrM/OscB [Mycolicibacterium helvum]BBY66859.1 radical SAM protein [Mycolicibacterium helvum]